MNANKRKSVAKDYIIFLSADYADSHRLFLLFFCGNLRNLRIDPSDRIIFPILNPNPGGFRFLPLIKYCHWQEKEAHPGF